MDRGPTFLRRRASSARRAVCALTKPPDGRILNSGGRKVRTGTYRQLFHPTSDLDESAANG